MSIDQGRLETTRKSRREYAAPRLINYGSLADLTLSGAFVGNDGNTKCTGNAGGNPQCEPLS
jgi:hypothetical protein